MTIVKMSVTLAADASTHGIPEMGWSSIGYPPATGTGWFTRAPRAPMSS